MTEKEAIEIIKYASAFNRENSPLTKALDTAIKALEEIQQYRAIGTAEDLKLWCSLFGLDGFDELAAYKRIGTVEECREAVEKQKAKKPRKKLNKYSNAYKCPNCDFEFIHKDETGWFCGKCYKYCPECGQAIDWSEKE